MHRDFLTTHRPRHNFSVSHCSRSLITLCSYSTSAPWFLSSSWTLWVRLRRSACRSVRRVRQPRSSTLPSSQLVRRVFVLFFRLLPTNDISVPCDGTLLTVLVTRVDGSLESARRLPSSIATAAVVVVDLDFSIFLDENARVYFDQKRSCVISLFRWPRV